MNTDVRQWAKSCISCQKTKVQRHTVTPLSTFSTPDVRFDQIHIDLVGPLPPSLGYTYILTCIDRFTRWPEAFPLNNITADSVAHAFMSGWISRFGTPSTITTDRGPQFESSLWHSLMHLLGSSRLRTTAYHPVANGLVERFHRQLKAALKAQPSPTAWAESLPLVLLGIRTALKKDLGCSTAELVYGTTLRLPGEFFSPSVPFSSPDPASYATRLKAAMAKLRPIPTRPHPSDRYTYMPRDLASCTHVFLRRDSVKAPLQAPYDGPFRVLQRADKFYTIEVNGRKNTVSLDRLKPAHLEVDSHQMRQPAPTLSEIPNPRLSDSDSTDTTDNPSVRTTRSGRQVHPPNRLDL